MGADDYDLTVGQVARRERTAPYPRPLRVEDREALFSEWCRMNPDALSELVGHAVDMYMRGMRVSAKYLIEWLRYDGTSKLHAVPFYDGAGTVHAYSINNSDTPLLARWLKVRYPGMRIERRSSMFDPDEGGRDGVAKARKGRA